MELATIAMVGIKVRLRGLQVGYKRWLIQRATERFLTKEPPNQIYKMLCQEMFSSPEKRMCVYVVLLYC